MTPGMLMIGVGRFRVGNGQGHEVVPGVGTVGTPVGVVVGCENDGFGGVFRLGGGVLDSSTIVVFGSFVGAVVGCPLTDAPGVGAVDGSSHRSPPLPPPVSPSRPDR